MQHLAGRLQWERGGTGIRAMIPARSRLLLDTWIGVLTFGAIALAIVSWRDLLLDSRTSALGWFNISTSIVGVLLLAGVLLWSFTGHTVVSLDCAELTLERRIAGLQWDRRRFPVNEVYDLRYVAPQVTRPLRTDTDPTSSVMRLAVAEHTVSRRESPSVKHVRLLIAYMRFVNSH